MKIYVQLFTFVLGCPDLKFSQHPFGAHPAFLSFSLSSNGQEQLLPIYLQHFYNNIIKYY